MNRLYIADVTEVEKTVDINTGLAGHKFNFDAVLKKDSIKLTHYKAGTTICLRIFGEFTIEAVCDRCVDAIEAEVDFSEEYYLFPENTAGDDIDYVYGEDYIELDYYINESIVVNMPQKLLCDDDCLGICPRCGQNLNEKECNCDRTFENI